MLEKKKPNFTESNALGLQRKLTRTIKHKVNCFEKCTDNFFCLIIIIKSYYHFDCKFVEII